MKKIIDMNPNAILSAMQIADGLNKPGNRRFETQEIRKGPHITFEDVLEIAKQEPDFLFLNWKPQSNGYYTLDSRQIVSVVKKESPKTKVIYCSSVAEMADQMFYFGTDFFVNNNDSNMREIITKILNAEPI